MYNLCNLVINPLVPSEGAKNKNRQFNFELTFNCLIVMEMVYLNAHYSVFWGFMG